MSLSRQVNALAERVGQAFQRQAKACPTCPWRWIEKVHGAQHTFRDNALMGAWFCHPPLLMAALPFIATSAWMAFWFQEER